jgi:hypothetical protein
MNMTSVFHKSEICSCGNIIAAPIKYAKPIQYPRIINASSNWNVAGSFEPVIANVAGRA